MTAGGERGGWGADVAATQLILNKFSLPLWISTKLNVADIFTKALDSTTFYKFRAALLNISYEHLPMELSDKIHVA